MATVANIASAKHKRTPPTSSKAVQRIDAVRSLEPARKKLTTLETQRVMAVLDECIKRSMILSTLPSLLENLSDYAIVLGRELVALLEEHAQIRMEFATEAAKLDIILGRARPAKTAAEIISEEDFWTRPRSRSTVSNKSTMSSVAVTESADELRPQQADIERKIQELLPRLQFSTRSVLRGFRNNPAAVTAVIGGGTTQVPGERLERTEDSRGLLEKMHFMRDIMMLRLMTTPSEKAERLAYLRDVSERERANTVVIDKLDAELHSAVSDKDLEVKKKNDVIRRLQTDIHHIEKFSEENIKRIKSEAEKQQAADAKNSDGKKQKLSQEMAQFKNQLNNMVNEHRDSEANLRRRKWKLETEVENWIQKYDNDMGDRQSEFEEIDVAYNEERKQLVELEERFKTLEEEYNQIQEERRIAKEKRDAQEREMKMMILAATTIQSFWRSYKVRKLLRGKRKGKGKGKGKGKR